MDGCKHNQFALLSIGSGVVVVCDLNYKFDLFQYVPW